MIIEFSIQNFLSIKEEQILSFEADKSNKYNDYFIIKAGKYNLLKLIAVCGPNSSGKTNLIDAFESMRRVAVESTGILFFGYPSFFAADPLYNSGNTEFKLDFLVEDNGKYTKYRYELIFNTKEDKIILEKLEYFPSLKPALIYERKADAANERGFSLKIPPTMKLKKVEIDAIKTNTFQHTTILSSFLRVNPIFPQAKAAFLWFIDSALPKISPHSSIMPSALQYFEESSKRKQFLIKFLENADINISGLSIYKKEEEVPDEMLKLFKNLLMTFPELNQAGVSDSKITRYDTQFIHKGKQDGQDIQYSLPIDSESLGTYRIFELAYPLMLALTGSKVLMIDEIESSLHLEMTKYFILVFLSNSKKSQMLFTTHNLLLLDWDIMRNDSIWFTEKQDSGKTFLYPLTSFKGINRQKILKQYMAGNFGALPDIYQYKFDLED